VTNSGGQILGPLVVTPLLRHGYHLALLLGAVIVPAAALAATVLRVGFPCHLPSPATGDAPEHRARRWADRRPPAPVSLRPVRGQAMGETW
jgi:hypothetical protein